MRMFYEPEHSTMAFAAKIRRSGGEETSCFRNHRHSQLEVILVMEGEYLFFTPEQEAHFFPGDVFMVNSGEEHAGIHCLKPEQKGYYYYIQLSLQKGPRGLNGELDQLLDALEQKKAVLPFRVPADQAKETGLFEDGLKLVHCFTKTGGHNELELLCKTLQFYQTILEHRLYLLADLKSQSPVPFVQQVASYVDQHYAEDLRLEDLAKLFGYEPHYFCTLFKKNFQITFSRYLRIVRIQKFLSHPNLNLQTIAECAADVGFSNYSYFYRSFRSNRGCSPREFLTQNRK